jgi:glutaredoxin
MTASTICRALALLAAAGLPHAAWAQYKVVNADGSVTYTDRPPSIANVPRNSQSAPAANRAASAPAADSTIAAVSNLNAGIQLPTELRRVMLRYPVTLYTSPACAPCELSRQMLQQRGVPYAEKRVSSEDDALAFERLFGGRSVPALTIGIQQLRGYSANDWGAYLDAAGYPRQSLLPRGWQIPQPTPLASATPAPSVVPPPSSLPPPRNEPPPLPPEPGPGGIRF